MLCPACDFCKQCSYKIAPLCGRQWTPLYKSCQQGSCETQGDLRPESISLPHREFA